MGTRTGRAACAIVAALLFTTTLALAQPVQAGVVATATLSGRVVDDGGAPLVDAVVVGYLPGDGFFGSTADRTDANGEYTLTAVPTGSVRVVAVAATGDHATQWHPAAATRAAATPIAVAAGTAIDDIDLALPVTASIAGTITDVNGDPVVDAEVSAYRPGEVWVPSATTRTASDGSYRISRFTGGDFRVWVRPTPVTGLVGQWYGGTVATTLAIADGDAVTGIDVTLIGQAAISGVVRGIGGDVVAGATVIAVTPSQTWLPSAIATTAGDGSYSLGLGAGSYQVYVRPPAGSGLAARWFGPSLYRSGSPAIGLGAGEQHPVAEVILPLDFPYAGSIDLDVADPDRCDVIATGCLLPFPNDRFTVADPSTPTGRRVAIDQASMPANAGGTHIDPEHWNDLDGFSPGAAPLLSIADVDLAGSGVAPITDLAASLEADGPIVLLDATTGARLAHWAELDTYAEPGSVPTLAVHPAAVLPEGHRIVVGVRGLVTTTAEPVAPTDGFRAFRDRLETDIAPVEARRDEMEQVFTDLAGAGVGRSDLIVAWDFTVASADALSGRLLHIRDDAFARIGDDAPGFTVTSNTASTREGIAREVIGTYEVPMYLSGTGRPGSEFVLGPDGLPTHTGTYTARFRCIVPTSATAATPATTGLYAHGLLGSYNQIGAARAVAVQGNRVFCGTDLIGMAEDDIGNAATIVQDVSRFNTLADRLQQGHLNTLFLGRLMIHAEGLVSDPAFQDGGQPLMDGGLIYYGISQGGIMGAATTAVAQDWTVAMLDVPGSNYSLLLDRSVDFDPFRSIMTPSYPAAADRALGLQLIQMLWDRGEANGYLQHLTSDPYPGTPNHRVLFHAAFGDHQVANISTAVTARSVDASAVRPALTPGRSAESDVFWGIPDIASYPHDGSAVVMWDSGADAPRLDNQPPRTGDDPHDNVRRTPAAIEQIVAFLATGTVIDVCGASPCAAVP